MTSNRLLLDIAEGRVELVGKFYSAASAVERRSYKTAAEVCDELLRKCQTHFSCSLCKVWSLDPSREKLVLAAVDGVDSSQLGDHVLDVETALSGVTAERQRPTLFDNILDARPDGRHIGDRDVIAMRGIAKLLSIPVLNTFNPNQVLIIVNLFFREAELFPETTELRRSLETKLGELSKIWANRFEAWLEDRCLRFSNRLEIEFAKVKGQTEKHLCKILAQVVKRAISCDSVVVYLEGHEEHRLESRSAVGQVEEHDKTKNLAGGPADRCWRENREWLSLDIIEETTNAPAHYRSGGKRLTAALVPLRNFSGQPKGVVRCMNVCPTPGDASLRPFTYEDIAVVEAISQAFAGQLAILWADRHRLETLTHFGHEIGVPVAAFRAVTERMEWECKSKKWHFDFNYFKDLELYTGVMNRQLRELDLMGIGAGLSSELEPERTLLLASILMPAIKSVEQLLARHHLPIGRIRTKDVEKHVPALYVDRALMTQVVFNLLTNAIKYFHGQHNDFFVEVQAAKRDRFYEFVFRDRGIGIPDEFSDDIFEVGVRAPNVRDYYVPGHGIGLWISRTIVRRHGGDLFVRRTHDPTEIVMTLPLELDSGPPKVTIDEDDYE